jgi:iron complex transport system ATP-binding protein
MTDASGIEIVNLSVRRGASEVLRDVSFKWASGKTHTLVGPNGSGKSTLLLALAGLLTPSAGTIFAAGQDLSRCNPRARARLVGWLPSRASVTADLQVAEVVGLGRLPWLTSSFEAAQGPASRSKVVDAMALLDVTAFSQRSIGELSTGEAQRVQIARVVAQDTPIMIFDEPTATFDVGQTSKFVAVLRRLQGLGKTIVIATHDLSLAADVSESCTMLKHGQRVASGSPTEVLTRAQIAATFDLPTL